MRRRGWQNLCMRALGLTGAVFASCASALAQCAMCKASAAGLDGVAARHMNEAIMLMVSPPVAIFCAFIYLTYKHRRPPGDDE
ncbi:MAG TPA: hypothetical protein VF525_01825 [Pyrinomonadaceae bacterium]|jgi:hypothetical protein